MKTRAYTMRKRAEQMDETRRRIVEAAVQLHEHVGPANTTVAAIAEAADVTRLTVYRHFPDDAALFAACSAHWESQQRLPDIESWELLSDAEERLREGLTDLYRFYRDGAGMLTSVSRDLAALPPELQEQFAEQERSYRDVLARPFEVSGPQRRLLRALVGHAVSFGTWRSLCLEQGLSNRQAVDALCVLVRGAVTPASGPSRTATTGEPSRRQA